MKTKQLDALKISLLEDMREYMEDVAADGHEPGYSEADIGKCESILDTFLTTVRSAKSGDTEFVMGAVKEAVLALNALNEDYNLIETDQREQICELIIQSAVAVGVGSGEDITEEWREW
jgi:hypothetical protein